MRAEPLVEVLVAAFPVTFCLTLLRPRRENASWAMAVTLFGVLRVGLPFAHAVFLRALPHGDGLLVRVFRPIVACLL